MFFRYIATGASFTALSYNFLMGATTVREVVKSTCKQLWDILQPLYMHEKNEEYWLKIADEFYQRTNFPNIISALDGKHIRITQPDNTGSEYFNYKRYFSQVFMAWVDDDYQFVYIDVGSYGAASDSSVFSNSNMVKRLEENVLIIPNGRPSPNDESGKVMPFCIVADKGIRFI
jgi:hypothetical protein